MNFTEIVVREFFFSCSSSIRSTTSSAQFSRACVCVLVFAFNFFEGALRRGWKEEPVYKVNNAVN